MRSSGASRRSWGAVWVRTMRLSAPMCMRRSRPSRSARRSRSPHWSGSKRSGRNVAIEPARYTCYRAAGPIVVDGKLESPSWRMAPKSTPFVDIVTGEPAWFDTRVGLLWDDDNLYFGFWMEENDVWGTMTERDSRI